MYYTEADFIWAMILASSTMITSFPGNSLPTSSPFCSLNAVYRSSSAISFRSLTPNELTRASSLRWYSGDGESHPYVCTMSRQNRSQRGGRLLCTQVSTVSQPDPWDCEWAWWPISRCQIATKLSFMENNFWIGDGEYRVKREKKRHPFYNPHLIGTWAQEGKCYLTLIEVGASRWWVWNAKELRLDISHVVSAMEEMASSPT